MTFENVQRAKKSRRTLAFVVIQNKPVLFLSVNTTLKQCLKLILSAHMIIFWQMLQVQNFGHFSFKNNSDREFSLELTVENISIFESFWSKI